MSFPYTIIKVLVRLKPLLPINNVVNNQVIRLASKTNCYVDPFPTCSEKEIAKTKCAKTKKISNTLGNQEGVLYKLKVNPECCKPCLEELPSFDSLLYKPSNKSKKKYTRTWSKCQVKLVQQNICQFMKHKKPNSNKRKRKEDKFMKTACRHSGSDRLLMKCNLSRKDKNCPRLILKFCKPVRIPPKCIPHMKPSGCKKICSPYPSFSECKSLKPNMKRITECDCLSASMCEAWREYRRLMLLKQLAQ